MKKKYFYKFASADFCFIIFLTVFAALMIRSVTYSVGNADEELLIMNAFRFVKGDRLLVDDWHNEQLCSIFLYLPVKMFIAVRGGTDGIVLYSRFLYVAVQILSSAIAYIALRKYRFAAVAAALLFFVNIPLDIFPLIYYNSVLCYVTLYISVLLISHREKPGSYKLILIGLFFAFGVLCSPYTAIIYFIYSVAVFVRKIMKKKNSPGQIYDIRSWTFLSIGVLIAFVLFCIYSLRGNNIGEIIRNIPMILRDGEYTGGIFDGIVNIAPRIRELMKNLANTFSIPGVIIGALLLIAVAADKKRAEHSALHLGLSCLWCILSLVIAFTVMVREDLRTAPVISAAAFLHPSAVAYAVTRNKDTNLFRYMYLYPLLIIVIRTDESLMDFLAGSSIAPVCFCSGTVMICECVRELMQRKKAAPDSQAVTVSRGKVLSVISAVFAVLAISCQLGSDAIKTNMNVFKSEYIFGTSKKMELMETRIEKGPLKGIKTTFNVKNVYDDILVDLDHIAENFDGPVMTPVEMCWIYLYLDENPIGTYAGYLPTDEWETFISLKMKDYYEYHPEKYPECIYIPYCGYRYVRDRLNDDILSNIRLNYNVTVTDGEAGYILKVKGQYGS